MSVWPLKATPTRVWLLTVVWWRKSGSLTCSLFTPRSPSYMTLPLTTSCCEFTPMEKFFTVWGTSDWVFFKADFLFNTYKTNVELTSSGMTQSQVAESVRLSESTNLTKCLGKTWQQYQSKLRVHSAGIRCSIILSFFSLKLGVPDLKSNSLSTNGCVRHHTLS